MPFFAEQDDMDVESYTQQSEVLYCQQSSIGSLADAISHKRPSLDIAQICM